MVEFSDREDLARWLEDKPGEWAVVIAARAALRAVPILSLVLGRAGSDRRERVRHIIFPDLRGIAASYLVAAWPDQGPEVAAAAARAAAAADVGYSNSATFDIAAAVAAAVRAAATAAADSAADAVVRAAVPAAHAAARAASEAVHAAVVVPGARPNHFWSATSRDASELEAGDAMSWQANELAKQSLWFGYTPDWAIENWLNLKNALLASDENWDVWTDWYEARLRGSSANKDLELARVMIADEIWQQGPKVVNAHIKELIAEFSQNRTAPKWGEAKWGEENWDGEREPPSVPNQRRAAIEPFWENGRLTLPRKPAPLDLTEQQFASALSALRSELHELVVDVLTEANIDKRPAQYIGRIADRIGDVMPTREELFRLGHFEDVLLGFAKVVSAEWPDFLAARYQAIVLQFDRTMRQSPEWREFKLNAAKGTLKAEQVVDAPALAREAANALREVEAPEFVDADIPNALERLVNILSAAAAENESATAQIEESSELLAADLIESVNNILKPIAEVALEYCQDAAKGFKRKAKEQAPKDGEKAFMWLRRLGMAGVAAGAGHFAGLSGYLAKYPEAFDWLKAVLRHLH